MTRQEAILEAKREARRLGPGYSIWAILIADDSYMVASRKPMLQCVKHDVIRCDWDGLTYPD